MIDLSMKTTTQSLMKTQNSVSSFCNSSEIESKQGGRCCLGITMKLLALKCTAMCATATVILIQSDVV